MSATIIDGKKTAAEMRAQIRGGVEEIKSKHGIVPCLAVILVGSNPASISYVTAKEKACAEAGITSFDNRLPENTTEAELIALIQKLNADSRVHGILVQLPLPKHIDENNCSPRGTKNRDGRRTRRGLSRRGRSSCRYR